MTRFSSIIIVVVVIVLDLDQILPQSQSSLNLGWLLGDKKEAEKRILDFWKGNQDDLKRKEGSKKIRFALYSRRNRTWVEIKTNTSLPKHIWQSNVPLKVLLHGYSKDTSKTPSVILQNQKIVNMGQTYGEVLKASNVVIMDWTALSVEPESHYGFVVESVPFVGEVLADFISTLVRHRHASKLKLSNVHMIGFGVGAHVAGVAGKLLQKKKKNGGKVGRITGIDPAGSGFDDEMGQRVKNKSLSLRKSDAAFVDIIHCSLGVSRTYQDAKLKGRYGSAVQAGHADFYPNGGTVQLRCKQKGGKPEKEKECHTNICPEYFTKSIQGVEYVACGCQNFDEFENGACNCTLDNRGVLMGEPCSKEAVGKYYLEIVGSEKSSKKKAKLKTPHYFANAIDAAIKNHTENKGNNVALESKRSNSNDSNADGSNERIEHLLKEAPTSKRNRSNAPMFTTSNEQIEYIIAEAAQSMTRDEKNQIDAGRLQINEGQRQEQETEAVLSASSSEEDEKEKLDMIETSISKYEEEAERKQEDPS